MTVLYPNPCYKIFYVVLICLPYDGVISRTKAACLAIFEKDSGSSRGIPALSGHFV